MLTDEWPTQINKLSVLKLRHDCSAAIKKMSCLAHGSSTARGWLLLFTSCFHYAAKDSEQLPQITPSIILLSSAASKYLVHLAGTTTVTLPGSRKESRPFTIRALLTQGWREGSEVTTWPRPRGFEKKDEPVEQEEEEQEQEQEESPAELPAGLRSRSTLMATRRKQVFEAGNSQNMLLLLLLLPPPPPPPPQA